MSSHLHRLQAATHASRRKAVGKHRANFYWFTQRNQSSRTPYLLNTRCSQLFDLSWSPRNDRWCGRKLKLLRQEYSDAGAVDKDTKKYLGAQ
jgi:hypothetical protein